MILKRVIGPKGQVILKPEKNPEKAVEEYVNTVRNKLEAEVDVKKVIEEEALERVVLHRQ